MSKLHIMARKCAAFGATVATFVASTVATLFSKCSNTVATLNCTLHWLVSHLKTPFNSLLGRNSSNTSPNFAQEQRFPDSWELGDEFDHEDYDEWWDDDDLIPGTSWQREAVDEAIDDEQPGQYPPTFNDDPNPWDGLFGKNRF